MGSEADDQSRPGAAADIAEQPPRPLLERQVAAASAAFRTIGAIFLGVSRSAAEIQAPPFFSKRR